MSSYDISQLNTGMLAYFDKMEKVIDEGKTSTRQMKLASLSEMCREIGIKSREFNEMQGGDEDEFEFYSDTIERFHELCDRYVAAGFMKPQTMENLEKTIFKRAQTSTNGSVVLAFPNWNAPDDFEDYRDVKQFAEDRGYTVKQLIGRLRAGEPI